MVVGASQKNWEQDLQEFLKFLVPTPNSCRASFTIREIGSELSPAEQARLTAEDKKRFSELTSPRKNEWSESRRIRWSLSDFDFCSLTHTHNLAIGWGLSDSSRAVRGIGIDAEPVSRVISKEALERFSDEAEREIGLSSVQLWTIKEATFKANPRNENTMVVQYRVLSIGPNGVGSVRGPDGVMYHFCSLELGPWRLALALLLS